MRRSCVIAIACAVLLPARPQGAHATQRLIDVRQIATDTLRDVAVAAFVQGRPTIYYNPVLLQGFGPHMAGFFFAHEYGHLRYGHSGSALAADAGTAGATRQRQELEADCYAAQALAEHGRESVEAAVRFFRKMGPFRYDAFHPTGAQRAAKLLSCLPPAPNDTAGLLPSESTSPREVSFTLRSPAASAGEYAVEARIWIDDAVVGTVSSIRQPGSIVVRGVPAGQHRYRLALKLFAFDAMLQLNPSGGATGEGSIVVDEGSVLAVRWRSGEAPTLVRQPVGGCIHVAPIHHLRRFRHSARPASGRVSPSAPPCKTLHNKAFRRTFRTELAPDPLWNRDCRSTLAPLRKQYQGTLHRPGAPHAPFSHALPRRRVRSGGLQQAG